MNLFATKAEAAPAAPGNLRRHTDGIAAIEKRKAAAVSQRDRITAKAATIDAAIEEAQAQHDKSSAALRQVSALVALGDDDVPDDARLPALRAEQQVAAQKAAALRDVREGLNAELVKAEKAIAAAEEERIEAVRDAIGGCLEEPCADYAQAARSLKAAARRVLAIQQIAREMGMGNNLNLFKEGALSETWVPNLASGIDGNNADYSIDPL